MEKPLTEWREIGVRRIDGRNLPRADVSASLILPAGYNGPAFLVYRNFRAAMTWNRSILYAIAVCHLADRLAGRPELRSPRQTEIPPSRRYCFHAASSNRAWVRYGRRGRNRRVQYPKSHQGISEVGRPSGGRPSVVWIIGTFAGDEVIMAFLKKSFVPCVILALTMALCGCAETQFLFHAAKRAQGQGTKPGGEYKIGKPYQVAGAWYYPKEDFRYDETGIASWYGPNFHGKTTANGDVFNQNALTAAHRTLPMPSIVRVTNLENGRSLVVTINDRGPFAKGRIIDMSKRSAELLGFRAQGTARVRVRLLAEESRRVAAGPGLKPGEAPVKVAALPKQRVEAATLPPPGGAKTGVSPSAGSHGSRPPAVAPNVARPPRPVAAEPIVTRQAVTPTNIFVQAGAFGIFDNANKVRARLSGWAT